MKTLGNMTSEELAELQSLPDPTQEQYLALSREERTAFRVRDLASISNALRAEHARALAKRKQKRKQVLLDLSVKAITSRALKALLTTSVTFLVLIWGMSALDGTGSNVPVMMLLTCLACLIVLLESWSRYPSVLALSAAAPANLLFFGVGGFAIIGQAELMRGASGKFAHFFDSISTRFGDLLPFGFLPSNLLFENSSFNPTTSSSLERAMDLSYGLSFVPVLVFGLLSLSGRWPLPGKSFNVWVNFPTFDPTGPGDIAVKLKSKALIMLGVGLLLPFLVVASVWIAPSLIARLDPATLSLGFCAISFFASRRILMSLAYFRVFELISVVRGGKQAESADSKLPIISLENTKIR